MKRYEFFSIRGMCKVRVMEVIEAPSWWAAFDEALERCAAANWELVRVEPAN